MSRLKVFAMFVLLTSPAAAIEQIGYYVDPLVASMQEYPTVGDELSLDTMVPIQKLEGGYLIQVSELYTHELRMAGAYAFLQTSKHYPKGTLLNGKKCKLTGMYTYTALDGFERSIYKVKEIQ